MDVLTSLSWSSWLTLTIISAIPLIYWHLTKSFNYWSKRGLKGPRPLPFVGNNLFNFITPTPLVELDWFKKFGKLFGHYNGKKPVLMVAKPELIKNILVKDFHNFSDRREPVNDHKILNKHLFNSRGDDWKRLRSIVSPTFTSGKMKRMYPMIRECLREFLDHLEPYARDRKDIDLKQMHGNYTMDVIATCAFATKTNSHKDPDNPFTTNANKVFNFPFHRLLLVFLLPKIIVNVFNIRLVEDSANDFFINLTQHILRKRKSEQNGSNASNRKKYNDFIQLLVDAEKDSDDIHDENDVNEAHHVNDGEEELDIEKKTLSVNVVDKRLSEEEIMAQGWIFFIAGYETTATTLSFCSYELALNPEVQERLFREVDEAVDSDGEISYEVLAKLPFLDAVLSETLRLYPPVLRLTREAMSDYKLGDTGIELYKGQTVEIPVYAIHHSEEYYPNAGTFNPDRFMPHNRHNITPYTYLPFGAGPRNCIGMRFALMEAKLGLAQIVRRYKFFRSEQTSVPLDYRTVIRLCSAKSVVVGIEKRS